MTKGGCVAGWNLTGNAVSAEFDGSDEQERKELSVSQAVEIAAGALDAIPQLSVSWSQCPKRPLLLPNQGRFGGRRLHHLEGRLSQAHFRSA